MSKIGVFICHCGENINATVDCARVAESCRKSWKALLSVQIINICVPIPDRRLSKQAIKKKGSPVLLWDPVLHVCTNLLFAKACQVAGLNPFMCEMANLREHCSWVHDKSEATTQKAIDLVRTLVEKVKLNKPLFPIKVPGYKKLP